MKAKRSRKFTPARQAKLYRTAAAKYLEAWTLTGEFVSLKRCWMLEDRARKVEAQMTREERGAA